MMSDFNTIVLDNNNVFEKKLLLDELEKVFPNAISIDKTAVRKQVQPLKTALENINVNNIKDSSYHLKIASLKVSYLVYRKGNNYTYQSLKNLIDKSVKKFLEDLDKIASAEDNIKKKMLEKSKKVFKDFLNAIIIKSYYPNQNDR